MAIVALDSRVLGESWAAGCDRQPHSRKSSAPAETWEEANPPQRRPATQIDPESVSDMAAPGSWTGRSIGITWLEKAYVGHSNLLTNLKAHPPFDPLRDAPRFHDLVRRVGLVLSASIAVTISVHFEAR
jgi:hypothetical protein